MRTLILSYFLFVLMMFSLVLGALAVAGDTFDENHRLFIPELRAGEFCYEDVGIQFFPGEDGMWSGGFELLQSRLVDCPADEEIEQCGNAFGPDCVRFDDE